MGKRSQLWDFKLFIFHASYDFPYNLKIVQFSESFIKSNITESHVDGHLAQEIINDPSYIYSVLFLLTSSFEN